MTRSIAFLIAVFAFYAPARAETLITGTYAKLVLDGDAGPFRVESPAMIGNLIAHNAADVQIDGGSFAGITFSGDALRFSGGSTYGPNPVLFASYGTVTLDVIDVSAGTADAADRFNDSAYRERLYARLLNGDVIDITIDRPRHDGPRPRLNLVYHDLPIDLDGDGLIGIAELNAVRENYGKIAPPADFDLSRTYIDFVDLNFVRNNFGSAYYPRASNPVPEPDAAGLALSAIVGFVVAFTLTRLTAKR